MPKLFESFEWMGDDLRTMDVGPNKIRIRGKAVPKGAISRNRRKYVDEELIKSARTWVGKPLTVNHAPWDPNDDYYDSHLVPGHIEWMEYENGVMEYQALISKQPYVSMLRDGSTEIQGVSIEADYRYNRCPQCDERFYSEIEFLQHMRDEHFVRIDEATYEPHGMLGRALSLVLSPEEPGITDTSIELMEKYNRPDFKPLSKLLETVTKTRKEEKKHMAKLKGKAVVKPIPRITPQRAREIKEQQNIEPGHNKDDQAPPTHPVETEAPPEDETKAEEGETSEKPTETDHVPPEEKVVEQSDELQCPEGFHYEAGKGRCVPDTIPEETPPVEAPVVSPPEAPKISPATTEQVQIPTGDSQGDTPVPHPVEDAPPKCPEGSHWDDEGHRCVPDTVPEEPVPTPTPEQTKVVELTLPPLLKLGEPFANYSSFDDCVSKNQDKDDPEAYCAEIERKTQGETVQEMYLPNRGYIRDIKIAGAVNILNQAAAQLNKNMGTVKEQVEKTQKAIEEAKKRWVKGLLKESELRDVFDKAYAKQRVTQLNEMLGKIEEFRKLDQQTFNERVEKIHTEMMANKKHTDTLLSNLATSDAKTTEETAGIKEKLDKTVKTENERTEEYDKAIKQLQDRLTEVESEEPAEEPAETHDCGEGEHWDEEQGKCVPNEQSPETKELKETVHKLQTDMENLQDKLKGNFKGSAKTPPSEAGDEYYETPGTEKAKKQ